MANKGKSGLDFLAGGGEMGKLVRSMDWSRSPLGAIDTWPQSLRTAASLCLASTFPISVTWGPRHIQIYNDGYWPICGAKHPHSMGQDFSECWASAWPAIGGAFESALAGQSAYLENQRMFLDRYGFLEETFFTFSFSPIRDESGGVGGLFHPVIEMTVKILSERRTRALRDLAARTGKAKSVEDVLVLATRALAEYELDLPFMLFYVADADGAHARLAAALGLAPGVPLRADSVALDDGTAVGTEAVWPLGAVLRSGAARHVDLPAVRFGSAQCGPYPELPKRALVLPITPTGAESPMGYMVAGVSSRLPFDEHYQSFVELVANMVTSAVANARAFEEERRRAEALVELDRAKTVFFSNISHELRTPLTLILGPIEDMLDDKTVDLSKTERNRLEVAHRNALRLLKLVNTLLDFSRIEAGRVEALFESIDLALTTSELASHFHSACERAGLRFLVDCPPLDAAVFIDREMWEKIVLNLLSNAFKFTLSGEIAIRLRAERGQAVLSVSDTGTGIPAQEMPRLFERFHRIAEAQGRTYEGTGIGLALVQELVKLHGGTIWAESEPGQGSTFHVAIPLGSDHLRAESIRATPLPASTVRGADPFVEEAKRWVLDSGEDAASGKGTAGALESLGAREGRPLVLVVDDNADMRDYVRRILANAACDVETANNGEAALAVAQASHPPDLVLTDVMMPKLDGFGLLRALRTDRRTEGISVILLSARAGAEARVEGLNAGADDYLVKPFGARELVARVEGSLRLAGMRRKKAEAERRVVEQALDLSEDRLRLALDSAQMGMWDWDLISDTVTWSSMCKAIFGKPAGTVMTYPIFLDSLYPEDRAPVDALCGRCLDPAIRAPFDTHYRVVWPDGGIHWVLARGKVWFDGERPVRFIGTALDVTDQKEAEANLRIMVDELSHRVKNTLAVIQSLTEQTFRSGTGMNDVRQALAGRLQALAETHTLLTLSRWESVDIAALIERTVEHLVTKGDARLSLAGPQARLAPKASLALGLVLHELSTNSAKHGAWARDGGRVAVSWHITSDDLVLEWSETGRVGLTPPARIGFGTQLINQVVEYDLDGVVTWNFRPGGLLCVLTLPLYKALASSGPVNI